MGLSGPFIFSPGANFIRRLQNMGRLKFADGSFFQRGPVGHGTSMVAQSQTHCSRIGWEKRTASSQTLILSHTVAWLPCLSMSQWAANLRVNWRFSPLKNCCTGNLAGNLWFFCDEIIKCPPEVFFWSAKWWSSLGVYTSVDMTFELPFKVPSGNLAHSYWKWSFSSLIFPLIAWWFSIAFCMFTRPGNIITSHMCLSENTCSVP